MAFPDGAWPCGEGDDDLDVDIYSTEKGHVNWDIHNFLVECSEGKRKELKSATFAFGGAKWNFFSKFDKRKVHSLFGINIRGLMPSDLALHCYCDIKFEGAVETKNIIFKFICETADSHCSVEDFLSDVELDTFLLDGFHIECDISIKKNDFSRSFAASPFLDGSFSYYPKPFTYSPMTFPNYPKVILDSTWPCGGDDLKVSVFTPEEGCVIWKIKSFLSGCLPRKKLRCEDFSFAGAKWNLFASFDKMNIRSLFGLSIREYRSYADLDCYCTITFKDEDTLKTMKHIVFKFKVKSANSQCTVEDFLPIEELSDFLACGTHIVCRFSAKKSSVREVCSAGSADISNSSRRNTFRDHTKAQLQDNLTASAPQTDSRSQPSGSVRSSAVLSPPSPEIHSLTSPYGGTPLERMAKELQGINNDKATTNKWSHNHSSRSPGYSTSAAQSYSGSKQSSLKSLYDMCMSDALFQRPRYSMDPLLSGYVESLPSRHYSDPSGGYRSVIPPGIAGQMHGVPGGDNRDPLGRNGGPGRRDEFQGNHRITPTNATYSIPKTVALSSPFVLDTMQSPPVLTIYMETSQGPPPSPVMDDDGIQGLDLTSQLSENCNKLVRDQSTSDKGYLESVAQSDFGCKPNSLKRLHEETEALFQRPRNVVDPLLKGYVEPLPGRHYSDPSGGYRSVIPPGIAGQMPGVPGGDNRDPLGRNGGPGRRDEFQGNHKDDEELPLVSSKAFKDFKNLLQSGEGADVTLQVQDQQFKAHRIIIMARSSVFASMIQNDMQGNASGIIKVEDCDPSSFPVLLEFLYCGGTEQLSAENVFSLYKSADKYDIQDLKMRCLQLIKRNLSVETFCETLCIAFEYPETNLLTVATGFFIRHFKQISSTPEWETFLSENPVKGNKLFMETAKLKF